MTPFRNRRRLSWFRAYAVRSKAGRNTDGVGEGPLELGRNSPSGCGSSSSILQLTFECSEAPLGDESAAIEMYVAKASANAAMYGVSRSSTPNTSQLKAPTRMVANA